MTNNKTKVNTERELEKAQKQFDEFEQNIKELSQDEMNKASKSEVEPQTKLSCKQMDKNHVYLTPVRTISVRDKFNEKFKEEYEYAKQHVQFIAENREIIGENIELWTRPYGGIAAEFWRVPVNKPIWGPRYLAEQIRRCTYHRLIMQEEAVTQDHGFAKFHGAIVADKVIPRLTAEPVSQNKSIFMGAAA